MLEELSGDTVLLVEDNDDDEALTQRALRRQGLQGRVVVARDGAEALEYLLGDGSQARPAADDPPRVILLDLKLPKVPGLEVLRQLRADPRTALVPVVIFTSSVEERDLVEGFRRGANSYVRKPIDSVQFGEVLGALSRYWLGVNERIPPRLTGDRA